MAVDQITGETIRLYVNTELSKRKIDADGARSVLLDAAACIENLEGVAASLTARVDELSERVAPVETEPPSQAALRLLENAQHAADQTIADAELAAERTLEEATAIRGSAEAEVQRIAAEARVEAERLVADADETARRTRAEAQVEADHLTAQARREAETTRADAAAEAERIRSDAQTESRRILADARAQAAAALESTNETLARLEIVDAHYKSKIANFRTEVASLQALAERLGQASLLDDDLVAQTRSTFEATATVASAPTRDAAPEPAAPAADVGTEPTAEPATGDDDQSAGDAAGEQAPAAESTPPAPPARPEVSTATAGSVFDTPPPPPPPAPVEQAPRVASVFDAPPATPDHRVASVFDAPPPSANVSPDHPAMGGRDGRDVVIDLTTERGARVSKRHAEQATADGAADGDADGVGADDGAAEGVGADDGAAEGVGDDGAEPVAERPRRRFEFFSND